MGGMLIVYWVISACLWLGLSLCLVFRWRTGALFGDRLTNGQLSLVVLVVSLLARVVFVFASEPRLSDDIWRYIHDGQTVVELERSPYAAAPIDSPLEYRGNYPELVSLYQPTSQYVFAALAWISPNSHSFRLGFVGFDLMIVGLILWWLYQRDYSPGWAALYAWHPLVVSEVAWSGHQDVIGIALLLLALVLVEEAQKDHPPGCSVIARGNPAARSGDRADLPRAMYVQRAMDTGLMAGAGAAFAAACAVKPIVLPLALPWGWSLRKRPRSVGLIVAAGLVSLVGLYLPFVLTDHGLGGMIDTGRRFTADWSFNGSIHALTRSVVGRKQVADWLMAGGLGCVLLGLTFKDGSRPKAAGAYFLAAMLLSSTAHPWYLLWALAFVPLAFNPATWVWSLTIGWAYFAWMGLLGGQNFAVPTWLVWVEYVPVYAALGWALGCWFQTLSGNKPSSANSK